MEIPPVLDYTKQIFSHTSLDGTVRHYDINKLERMVKELNIPDRLISVDEDHTIFVIQNRGVELEHLDRISIERLKDPGIMIDFGEDQLLADGSHRYVKLYSMGMDSMLVYWFTEEQAKKALLDLPKMT